jgi:hypothetical protein
MPLNELILKVTLTLFLYTYRDLWKRGRDGIFAKVTVAPLGKVWKPMSTHPLLLRLVIGTPASFVVGSLTEHLEGQYVNHWGRGRCGGGYNSTLDLPSHRYIYIYMYVYKMKSVVKGTGRLRNISSKHVTFSDIRKRKKTWTIFKKHFLNSENIFLLFIFPSFSFKYVVIMIICVILSFVSHSCLPVAMFILRHSSCLWSLCKIFEE